MANKGDDDLHLEKRLLELKYNVDRRSKLFAQLTTVYDGASNVAPGTVSQFLARCQDIGKIKDKFDTIQDLLLEINVCVEAEEAAEIDNVQKSFDDLYYKIRSVEQDLKCRMSSSCSKSQDPLSVITHVKLPNFEIPKWNGEMDTFNDFWILYESVIHQGNFSNVLKFTYLRRALETAPNAFNLIKNLLLSDDNYATAYSIIKSRYGSARSLAAHYVNKILDFKPLINNTYANLQQFIGIFDTSVAAFNNLDLDQHDFLLFQCALRALPTEVRVLFERSLSNRDEIPSFSQLLGYVQDQCTIHELTKCSSGSTSINSRSGRNSQTLLVTPANENSRLSKIVDNNNSNVCPICKDSHVIYSCMVFQNMSVDEKYGKIKALRRCFRCLGAHHRSKCTSKRNCKHCSNPSHHSFLHDPKTDVNSNLQVDVPLSSIVNRVPADRRPPAPHVSNNSTDCRVSQSQTLLTSPAIVRQNTRTVLLGTAQALIRNKWGRMEPIRLVIDVGSQICLISSECAQRLALPVSSRPTTISGALSQNLGTSEGVVSCVLSPRHSRTPLLEAEAVVVRKVCSDLPTTSLSDDVFRQFSHLQLADLSFCQKGKIDFLLGAALYSSLFSDSPAVLHGKPAAFETVFGWVIIGDVSSVTPSPQVDVSLMICDVDLDKTLQSFWNSEEVSPRTVKDPLHEYAEQSFVSSHSRRSDGSYVVRMPFKPNHDVTPFGDTEDIARHRWLRQESRLKKDIKLKEAYNNFMKEYIRMGHMKPSIERGMVYIPHFAVMRDSSTSPVRVVFDASCKDSLGSSLNDRLLVGPPLQKDICTIITLFSLEKVALVADVRMMYRHIWMHPDDCLFQHVFWRENESDPLLQYQLLTLTYGLASAPFLAQRTTMQLVRDEGHSFPMASKAVLSCCYMDDICTSSPSEKEALTLKTELIELFKSGGFELRKWASNVPSILSDIPPEHQISSLSIQSTEISSLHILGLHWEPRSDVFTYSVKPLPVCNSKRQVLSRIASLFDPLGWISPVIFKAKLFLRELWERGLDWDSPLPSDLKSRWEEFSSQLLNLPQLKIPRRLLHERANQYQLIGFSDASMLGYAAAVYLRCSTEDGTFCSSKLIRAKTRVAPLKVVTVPRLELNGAHLLSQLLESIQFLVLRLKITEVHLFTDSSVVLGWLHTPPHRLQTFVANRVVAILENTKVSQWRHVVSANNSADMASRGLLPNEIIENPSWWAGPDFLRTPTSSWPNLELPMSDDLPEVKHTKVTMFTASKRTKPKEPPLVVSIIERFSSLSRLKRVMAWILRFVHNTRQVGPNKFRMRRSGPLQPFELHASMYVCVKATQFHYFGSELQTIQKGKLLSPRIRRLSPFIHNGILRVGGRLTHSLLPSDVKHPPLLPKQSHLSSLICDSYHRKLLHAGPQCTQAVISQEFWILSLRALLRHRIFKCMSCYRHRLKENHPIMADLPPSRVTPSRPFSRTAVDFAGPFLIKTSTRRNAPCSKVYLCVFVCMTTKAVHLELAGDLSTECYVGALNRLIARRGLCSDVYCDNGTNFVGASSEGEKLKQFLLSSADAVAANLADQMVTYHFNSPAAPWTGGLWEAAVKAAKRHLRDISIRHLTYEEFLTVITRVEAVLNSRPLCPIGDSPDSLYLSPAHFLIGGPMLTQLEHDLSEEPANHLSRWQSVQQASQVFWKRWSTNYLQTLMERQKWTKPRKPLCVGDVVILLKSQTRPQEWPLGRVSDLLYGPDGIARSAIIETAKGSFTRPVAKLALLPTEEED